MLKINIYGYLNRIQSTRRLEREAQRNVELMWLTGRLAPDFKTIADFRKDNGKAIRSVCRQTGKERRVKRWEHEAVIDAMQARLEHDPGKMRVRRQTVEHPFGTLKYWMGATHFLTKTLPRVSTEMSLHVLAYNLKRMMSIFGIAGLLEAIRA